MYIDNDRYPTTGHSICIVLTYMMIYCNVCKWFWGRRGRDRMVVGFTTTYAISAYHH